MKSPHTNSTFGFLPTRKMTDPKKPKELFFANAPKKSNFDKKDKNI